VITILVAGLWPFHAPSNNVEWLGHEDGLQFGYHGSVVSAAAFNPSRDASGSLEIWIEPSPAPHRHTILAFEGTEANKIPFRLQQDGSRLIVQRHNVDGEGVNRIGEFAIEGALPRGKRVFVTVTLGPQETSVYLNGALARTAASMGTSTANFTGRLVLGNAPSVSDSWPGKVLSLAIFENQLTPSLVAEHFESWEKNHPSPALTAEQPAALYLFNEHAGRTIHNQAGAPDLAIPVHYFVLQPEFLTLPWRYFHSTWSYWGDVAVNIAGFIPFGFFVCAYMSSVRPTLRSAAITIVLGFLASLTIEVSQAFLPTRDSGVNDLITNTLGTSIGVLLYRSDRLQDMVSRLSSWVVSGWASPRSIGASKIETIERDEEIAVGSRT
jgi:VanZ family protein